MDGRDIFSSKTQGIWRLVSLAFVMNWCQREGSQGATSSSHLFLSASASLPKPRSPLPSIPPSSCILSLWFRLFYALAAVLYLKGRVQAALVWERLMDSEWLLSAQVKLERRFQSSSSQTIPRETTNCLVQEGSSPGDYNSFLRASATQSLLLAHTLGRRPQEMSGRPLILGHLGKALILLTND